MEPIKGNCSSDDQSQKNKKLNTNTLKSELSFNVDSEGFILLESDTIDKMLGSEEDKENKLVSVSKENEEKQLELPVCDVEKSSNLTNATNNNTPQKVVDQFRPQPDVLFNLLQENEDDNDNEEEESTCVLPANQEEWNKMFLLVKSQSNSCNKDEFEELKQFENIEKNMNVVNIDRQMEIFRKLCKLANIVIN